MDISQSEHSVCILYAITMTPPHRMMMPAAEEVKAGLEHIQIHFTRRFTIKCSELHQISISFPSHPHNTQTHPPHPPLQPLSVGRPQYPPHTHHSTDKQTDMERKLLEIPSPFPQTFTEETTKLPPTHPSSSSSYDNSHHQATVGAASFFSSSAAAAPAAAPPATG